MRLEISPTGFKTVGFWPPPEYAPPPPPPGTNFHIGPWAYIRSFIEYSFRLLREVFGSSRYKISLLSRMYNPNEYADDSRRLGAIWKRL